MNKELTILCGGGSPHSESYRPVYALLEGEAGKRGLTSRVIDYVGVGHHPDFGEGLSLPAATAKARKELEERPPKDGSTLLCRSFGCDVGAYLLAHHPGCMTAFDRVIFWGASAHHVMWGMTGRHQGSIKELNEEAAGKGLQLAESFWKKFHPIEESVQKIQGIQIEIAYGTEDKYCDAAFANYLAALLFKHTACPVRIVEIKGAKHEIRPDPDEGECQEEHERIKQEYFDLIFPNPQSEISNQQS